VRLAALFAVAAVAAGLGACGGDAARPAGFATSDAAGAARAVTFPAADGVRLHGTLRPAARRGAPAVVLAHQYGRDRHDFDGFVGALHAAGYTSLAYDARDQDGDDQNAYFTKLPRDIAGAVAFLRQRPEADRARIGLIGASIGASSAVLAIGTSSARTLRAAVALSPRAGPQVRPRGARPHDVLYVADDLEIGASRALAALTAGAKTLEIPGGGHGVALLPRARVRTAIIAWLDGHLGE
jgi:dienelactone hydrolase